MNSLISRLEGLNKWFARFGGAILLIAAIITTYDVILRFVINKPTDWALEISQYCLLYGTMLGAAYAFKDDLYIRVDVITNLLPEKKQRFLRLLGDILAFLLFALLAWYSGKYTLFCFSKGWTQNTALRTPMWIPLIIIPIGSIIVSLQNLVMVTKYWAKR